LSKKTSLSAALKGIEKPASEARVETVQKSGSNASPEKILSSRLPKSRVGKKIISGHFDPAVSKQFRAIGLEMDRTGQDLLAEALNDLFVKHGKSPIA